MEIPYIVGEANDFVTTTNLIKFKVDMEDSSSGNYNVMLKVFVDDQDVQEMSFDELSHSSIRIKVYIFKLTSFSINHSDEMSALWSKK